jgi:hypothetical protein
MRVVAWLSAAYFALALSTGHAHAGTWCDFFQSHCHAPRFWKPACPPSGPCWGYYPTCWRPWPADCPACPPLFTEGSPYALEPRLAPSGGAELLPPNDLPVRQDEMPDGGSRLRPIDVDPGASESPSDPPPQTPPQGALRPLSVGDESAGLGDLRAGGAVQISDEREVELGPRARHRARPRPASSRIAPPPAPGTRRQYVE